MRQPRDGVGGGGRDDQQISGGAQFDMTRCWRGVPSGFRTLMGAELGMYAIGLTPQMSNPRISFSPPA